MRDVDTLNYRFLAGCLGDGELFDCWRFLSSLDDLSDEILVSTEAVGNLRGIREVLIRIAVIWGGGSWRIYTANAHHVKKDSQITQINVCHQTKSNMNFTASLTSCHAIFGSPLIYQTVKFCHESEHLNVSIIPNICFITQRWNQRRQTVEVMGSFSPSGFESA
jgi:hypothetical protein